MTSNELAAIHAEVFEQIRTHSHPCVHALVDSMERALELSVAHTEAIRFQAALLDGMLGTRLANVERHDD